MRVSSFVLPAESAITLVQRLAFLEPADFDNQDQSDEPRTLGTVFHV
jgi:hypothetical protein